MYTFGVVFRDADRTPLMVEAAIIDGRKETDRGDSHTFRAGGRVVAVVPKAAVLYIEKLNE